MNPAIASAIARSLFHFLWEGAAIAALAALGLAWARQASARARYALACAAMLCMVAAFGVTLAWLWPHLRSLPAQAAARTVIPVPADWARPEFVSVPSGNVPWLKWAAPLWMLGVALFSLRSLVSWLAAVRWRRSGVAAAAAEWQEALAGLAAGARLARPVKLLQSYLTDVPVVIGWLKPVILVPASLFTGFPPEHLECILLHELAHIRRRDYLVNILQTLTEDLLFYHPAVWWVSSVIRAEREHCCDDEVVAQRGEARGLAAALAELEQQRWSVYEAALAANGGHLMNRVRRLLDGRAARPRLAAPLGFSASVLIAAAAIAVSIGHAQNAPPAPPAAPAPASPAAPASPLAPQPAAPPAAAAESPYQKWLNEEVFWIITPEERAAFRRLTTDSERDAFIEQFWLKRDPTPNTSENEYKEEHYRRILYANDNFSTADVLGWKTDRGMIYIKYGPPDERDEHPSGGTYQRPIEEGGGTTTVYPFEDWRYRYIEGIGNDVLIEFVDTAGKGEYHMTADPAAKDKLLYVPGAGLTLVEQLGLAGKSDRFARTDGTRLGTGHMPLPASMDQFTRLEEFAQLQAPPKPVVPPADAIEAMVFKGARRTPQELLLNLIPTREGDKLDQEVLDRDVNLLRNTGRFDDVQVGYARGKVGWVVTFTVVETVVERPAPRVDDRLLK